MPDEPKEADAKAEPQAPVNVITGVAGAAGAITQALTMASRWTAQQVITVFAVISVVVTNSVLVWLLFETKNDRRDERRDSAERSATLMRSVEDARERDRQFQALQRENDRQADMASEKMILAHCADEARKQRESDELLQRELNKTLQQLSAEVGRLAKKPGEEEATARLPVRAPSPKAKEIIDPR